jgi:hypothetical protein
MLGLLAAGGCLGDFQTPSAYQSQQFYCDDDHAAAFEALATPCKAMDSTCSGAFSMKGTMQTEPFTVGTTLDAATVTLVRADATAPSYWDIIRMTGSAPYFQFVFHLKSVGGDVSMDMPKEVTIHAGAGVLPNSLNDDQTEVGQTLQVGGENAEQPGLTDSGIVDFTVLSPTEIRGTFHGSFGGMPDIVDGCFLMYPDQTLVNPLPTP